MGDMASRTGPNPQNNDATTSLPDRNREKTRWTVNGISVETRTAVKKAAQQEGMSIGDWVDRTLDVAATNQLKGGTPVLALPTELLDTLDDISQKLDRIHHEFETDPDRFTSFSFDFGEFLTDARNRMGEAFERLQQSTTTVVDSAAKQTDAVLGQTQQAAGKMLDRIVDASDAARQSINQPNKGATEKESSKK